MDIDSDVEVGEAVVTPSIEAKEEPLHDAQRRPTSLPLASSSAIMPAKQAMSEMSQAGANGMRMIFPNGLSGLETPPPASRMPGSPGALSLQSGVKTARPVAAGAELFETIFGINPNSQPDWDLEIAIGQMDIKMSETFSQYVDNGGEGTEDNAGRDELLAEAAKSGFGLHREKGDSNPVAAKWANALRDEAGLKEAYKNAQTKYKGCKKRDAQAKLRMDWAKQRFEESEKKRVKTKSLNEIESWTAQYLPFGRLWEKEGKDAAGFQAIVSYVSAAALMEKQGVRFKGFRWSKYHSMTNRVRWLWVEEEFRSEMQKTWKCVITEFNTSALGGPGGGSPGGDAPLAITGASGGANATAPALQNAAASGGDAASGTGARSGKGEGKSSAEKATARTATAAKSKAKAAAKQGAQTKPPKDDNVVAADKERKKAVKTALATFSALKDDLNDCSSSFSNMSTLIAKDRTWALVGEQVVLEPLRQARAAVEMKRAKSDFWKKWDAAPRNQADWWNGFSEDLLLNESGAAAQELKGSVDNLNKIMLNARNVHAQMMEIMAGVAMQ